MNTKRLIGLTAAFGLAFASTAPCRAENPFARVAEALSRVVGMSEVMNLGDYDYEDGNSMFGVWLQKSQSHSLRSYFQKGQTYLILAAGDSTIADLDLTVETERHELVVKDTEPDPAAAVEFTAQQSGRLLLVLKNYESATPGFAVMVVLRKSGTGRFALDEIGEALGRALVLSRIASLANAEFATGNFCLFGGRLTKGGSTYIYNVRLPQGKYVLVSAGSANVNDVDAQVIVQHRTGDPAGTVVAKDDENAPVAVCPFEARADRDYRLEHRNYSTVTGGSGFVFSCLLRT